MKEESLDDKWARDILELSSPIFLNYMKHPSKTIVEFFNQHFMPKHFTVGKTTLFHRTTISLTLLRALKPNFLL